jgi:hypothetical protein
VNQVPVLARLNSRFGAVGVCSSWFGNQKRGSDAEYDADFAKLLGGGETEVGSSSSSQNISEMDKQFCVIVLRSGRFAGGIFDGATGNVVSHKVFLKWNHIVV